MKSMDYYMDKRNYPKLIEVQIEQKVYALHQDLSHLSAQEIINHVYEFGFSEVAEKAILKTSNAKLIAFYFKFYGSFNAEAFIDRLIELKAIKELLSFHVKFNIDLHKPHPKLRKDNYSINMNKVIDYVWNYYSAEDRLKSLVLSFRT